MSFEMKYDRDGNPIKSKEAMHNLEEEVEKVEQNVMEQPEIEQSNSEDDQESTISTSSENEESIELEIPTQSPVKKKITPAESIQHLRNARDNEEKLRKQLEQANQDLLRRIKEMESRSKPSEEHAENNYNNNPFINPDDLAEGKHVLQIHKEVSELKKELGYYKQQSTIQSVNQTLRTRYPDFDRVVTADNLRILETRYPELAYTLNNSQDLMTTGSAAYTMLKNLNIAPTEEVLENKARVEKNYAKPRSLTSISPQQGDSPLSKANAFANGLTQELKEQLKNEMYAAMKNN